MSARTSTKSKVREGGSVADNPEVVAYAFVNTNTSTASGKTFQTIGAIRKGKAWPEGTSLGELNAQHAQGAYIKFLHINGAGNGLITYMVSNGRDNGNQGEVA